MTAHTWDTVCLALRARLRCVAIDLRGYGDSDWSADQRYEYDDYAADVRAVVAHLALRRPILVGQSLGGFVSIVVAASSDPPVAGIVIVDAGPRMRGEGRGRVLDGLRERAEARTFEDHFRRSMASGAKDPDVVRVGLQQSLREDGSGRVTWKWDPYQFLDERRDAREARRGLLPPLLPRVTCPVLVVRGGRSDLLREEDARAFAATLAHGRVVTIPGAGHNVQANEPVLLAAAIAQWTDEAVR